VGGGRCGNLGRGSRRHRRTGVDTGVAGLTLGSGSGWIDRSFGLVCDNLVSVEVVTADGRVLVASDEENPDLFWRCVAAAATSAW
jgi:FAD/FMN-containing dehydrogenase